jgi:hypothetical protein
VFEPVQSRLWVRKRQMSKKTVCPLRGSQPAVDGSKDERPLVAVGFSKPARPLPASSGHSVTGYECPLGSKAAVERRRSSIARRGVRHWAPPKRYGATLSRTRAVVEGHQDVHPRLIQAGMTIGISRSVNDALALLAARTIPTRVHAA